MKCPGPGPDVPHWAGSDQILRNWQLDNQEPTLAFVTGFLNTGKY